MRARVLLVLGAVLAMLAVALPAQAIKGGVPDEGAHPYGTLGAPATDRPDLRPSTFKP